MSQDTGWVKPDPSLDGTRYRIKNKSLTITLAQIITLSGQTTLFTLPDEYRLNVDVIVPSIFMSEQCLLAIYINGNVDVIPITKNGNGWLYAAVTIPI